MCSSDLRALGFERSGKVSSAAMRQYVQQASLSRRVCEVIVHPGRLDARMQRRYAHWQYDWDTELRELMAARAVLSGLGDALINFEGAARCA